MDRGGIDLALVGGDLAMGSGQLALQLHYPLLGGPQLVLCDAQRRLCGIRPRAGGLGEPFGRHHRRASFFALLRQRVLRGRLRLLPQGADHLAGGVLQRPRQIGMLDGVSSFSVQ
nr:hypothetical protein [uncultured bacterium]